MLNRNKTYDLNVTKEEYTPNILEDEEHMYLMKKAIMELPLAEKNIMLMYLEFGTYVDVARVLRVSTPTCKKRIVEIIEKIKNKCNGRNN